MSGAGRPWHELILSRTATPTGAVDPRRYSVKVTGIITLHATQTTMKRIVATCLSLLLAATLVLPSKKIADLSVENILNRFGEKSFARGANREIIKKCEEFLAKFIRFHRDLENYTQSEGNKATNSV